VIWVLLVLAGVGLAPFAIEYLRKRMDSNARSAAPGGFARLSDGVTHFRWIGPERGRIAVCVHGLTTPSLVWQAVAEGLAEDGYRVLVYDLYGRGYSDRPRKPHDRALFHRQLDDLLTHLGITGPVTLLGYSMGGAIGASWAAAHPGRVERLILLAPAGMGHDLGRIARITRDWPVIGDWLFLTMFPRGHRKGTEAERPIARDVPGIIDYQQDELRWRGFLPAVLSSLRGMLAEVLENDHRALRQAGLPVLAIWGRDDRTIPIKAMGVMAQWNPDAHHEVVDGAGHGLPYSHARNIVDAVRNWQV
jgi:pimeloyl-ACP methyl ester carboxylesterase